MRLLSMRGVVVQSMKRVDGWSSLLFLMMDTCTHSMIRRQSTRWLHTSASVRLRSKKIPT